MTRPNLQVNLKTFQRKWRIDPTYVRKFLREVWTQLCKGNSSPEMVRKILHTLREANSASPAPVEVTVVLLNDRQITAYNHQYRKKNYPTDVLSFPVNELQDEGTSFRRGKRRQSAVIPKDQIFYLGDILISMERTASQANAKNHSMQRELKILLLHGILHLLGYDHEADNGQMVRLERKLRKAVL